MRERDLRIYEPTADFYSQHVTFKSVSMIKNLLGILKDININYFTFERSYKDSSHFKLTSNSDWIRYYYDKKLYNYSIFERNPYLFSNGYIFWQWFSNDLIYSEAINFDIAHGITVIYSDENYTEFYHFGTSSANPPDEMILLSNLKYLYQFIALFKEKAHRLIIEAEDSRFILPYTGKTASSNKVLALEPNQNLGCSLFNNIKRLYFGDQGAYLTGKEIQILASLKSGKKVPDIAKSLSISIRTVETHINNIKEKLNCRTMFELGFTMNSLNIHNILPVPNKACLSRLS